MVLALGALPRAQPASHTEGHALKQATSTQVKKWAAATVELVKVLAKAVDHICNTHGSITACFKTLVKDSPKYLQLLTALFVDCFIVGTNPGQTHALCAHLS